MTPDRDDPLIDALLDETLGGVHPPDLSARILQEWSARQAGRSPSRYATPIPLSVTNVVPQADADVAPQRVLEAVPPRYKRRRSSPIVQVAVSLSAAALVFGVVYLGLQSPTIRPGEKLVAQPSTGPTKIETKTPKSPTQIAKSNDAKKSIDAPEKIVKPSVPEASAIVEAPSPEKSSNVSPETSDARPSSSHDPRVVAFINKELHTAWKENGIKPSAQATDAEWCRRTYLRVIGRIPTVDEVKRFADDRSANRNAALVDRLMNDEHYVEEYARYWSTVFANLLVGRTGGTEPDDAASREGLEQYLRRSLAANKSYERLTLELVSATGTGRPGSEGFNGAANYLLANADDDGTLAAARTCRVFLGMQLQCAQCHNHPTEDWKQGKFWGMTAFFRQMTVERDAQGLARLTNRDFLGDDGRDEDGSVFYELPSGVVKASPPVFIDGSMPHAASGRIDEVNRREELAKFIVKSEQFPQALVNRMWSHFLGYGFTRPVDDMRPSHAASHPALLNGLANDFRASGYDLKSVIRWITLSDAFNRSSRMVDNSLADLPEAGTMAYFSHYYTRQMQAEEVFRSLQIAAKLRREAGSTGNIEQARVDWLAQFNRNMGTDEGDEESQFNGTIKQSLVLMNGDLMRRATTPAYENMLHGVMKSTMKFDEKVEHLFLAALSRKPTKRELDAARSLAGMNKTNEAAAIEDIWWALLNSNEFILDH